MAEKYKKQTDEGEEERHKKVLEEEYIHQLNALNEGLPGYNSYNYRGKRPEEIAKIIEEKESNRKNTI